MKTRIETNGLKTMFFSLLLLAVSVFAGCAPRYGCYYGMDEAQNEATEGRTVHTCNLEIEICVAAAESQVQQ